MKRRLILAAPFLMAAVTASAQSWTEYRTEDGRFRAQLPGTPTVQKSSLNVSNTETAPTVEALVRTPGATFQIASIVYPRRIGQSASTDVLLDHFRNNMTAGQTYKNEKTLTWVGRRVANSC